MPSNSKDPDEPWGQSQAVVLDSGPSTQLQGAASLSCSPEHSVPWEGSLSSSFLPLQGPRAEAMLHNAMEQGNWVFFQNCHLAPSWMPSLERLIEGIDPGKVKCFTEQVPTLRITGRRLEPGRSPALIQ